MPDLNQQACPLCANLSRYEVVCSEGSEPRKVFSCDICSDFVISHTAEQWLSAHPRKCEELSNLSSFLYGDLVLHIFMESSGDSRALLAIPDGKSNWVKA